MVVSRLDGIVRRDLRAAVLLGEPAEEAVAGAARLDQAGVLAVVGDGDRFPAFAAVGIEEDIVDVCLPVGVEGVVARRGDGVLSLDLRFAILDEPAEEAVAGAGRGSQAFIGAAEGDVQRLHRVAAVCVEGDLVALGRPVRKEGVVAVGLDRRLFRHLLAALGEPTGEVVARAGRGWQLVVGRIIGNGAVANRAAAVRVKADGVGVRFPVGVEGVILRPDVVHPHDLCAADLLRIPAVKAVAGARYALVGQVGVGAADGDRQMIHRSRAAVGVEGDGVVRLLPVRVNLHGLLRRGDGVKRGFLRDPLAALGCGEPAEELIVRPRRGGQLAVGLAIADDNANLAAFAAVGVEADAVLAHHPLGVEGHVALDGAVHIPRLRARLVGVPPEEGVARRSRLVDFKPRLRLNRRRLDLLTVAVHYELHGVLLRRDMNLEVVQIRILEVACLRDKDNVGALPVSCFLDSCYSISAQADRAVWVIEAPRVALIRCIVRIDHRRQRSGLLWGQRDRIPIGIDRFRSLRSCHLEGRAALSDRNALERQVTIVVRTQREGRAVGEEVIEIRACNLEIIVEHASRKIRIELR